MIILGIDLGNPGGLAVVATRPRQPGRAGIHGLPLILHTEPLREPDLYRLQRAIAEVARRYAVDALACEKPGFWGRHTIGMAQRGKRDLAKAVADCYHVPLVELQPQTVKAAVTGHGRATKDAIGHALRRLFGGFPHDANEHVADAVAIGWVALSRRQGEEQRERTAARGRQRRMAAR